MDLKALQLASRFSLPPNSLGYCGRDSAPEKLKNCIIGGVCGDVKNELEKFIVLNPYLETLSVITRKDKFSYDVVKAYWFGNDLLKKAKPDDYKTLLDNFTKQGVPPWLIKELRGKRPRAFIPNHLFQVLHVGVGRASGSVPYNIETINNCMIRWGKVREVRKTYLTVDLNSLDISGGGYSLAARNFKVSYLRDFIPDPVIGGVVAVHWNQAVKILTVKEGENLDYWTRMTLDSCQ